MDEKVSGWRRWLRADVALTLVAVVAGTGGAVLAGQYLTERASAAERQLAGRYAGREVVVAATDLPRGAVLSATNLAARSVPQAYLPADAVPASRAGQLLGARVAIDIKRGTPIVSAALAEGASAAKLSDVLGGDERALTVSVDDLNSQAGGLRPGDRVDLYYSERAGGGALLVPLLQQVEILGVGESFAVGGEVGRRSFSTVTLRVRVDEAPKVLLAQHAGDLSVLLRSPADTNPVPVVVRSSNELLRAPVPRRQVSQVELLVGGQGEQVPARRVLSVTTARAAEAS